MALQKKTKKNYRLKTQLARNCVSRLQATDSVSKMKLQDLGLLIQWNIIYNLSHSTGWNGGHLDSVDVWLTEMQEQT